MGFNKGGDRKRTHAEFNRRAQNQIHEDRRDQRKEEQQDMYARAYAARDRKQRKTNLPPRQNPIISKEAWDQQNELYDRTGVSNPNGRFLEEPNPMENGEIANCEIIEEEGEEEIVGGQFHNTLESLYKKNTNL